MSSFFRKLILILGDCGCICLATIIGIFVEDIIMSGWVEPRLDYHMHFLPIMLLLMLVFFNVYGLFSIIRKHLIEIFLNLVAALTNIFVVAVAITFWFREFSFSRAILIYTGIACFLLLAIWNFIMHKWEANSLPQQNVLILADQNEYKHIVKKLLKTYGLENATVDNIDIDNLADKLKDATMLVIGNSIAVAEREKAVALALHGHKEVVLVPGLYEVACQGMDLWQMDDLPTQKLSNLELTMEQNILKRGIDLLIAVPMFIFLFPLLFLVAILVKLDSSGSAIYTQERVGYHGKTFILHKFRSMRQDAEIISGPVLAAEHDCRITKLGRILRAARLDELPQLWDVIVGNMSLVGPRPERPFFVEQFVKEKPEYAYRHNVKPGITGLAQVNGKYNTNAYDKLVYDLLYIQNYSVANDFIIMLQTIKVIITNEATEGVK